MERDNFLFQTSSHTTGPISPPVERKRNVQFIFLFFSALFATFIWVYYLSRGFSLPGILDAYTDIQAYALRKGQIALMPDYQYLFYHDVSLYKGNYYFYWGILPAVLHAFLSTLTGRTISSYIIVSLFLFLFVYFFQRIIFEIMNADNRSSSSNGFITCAAIILAWILIFSLPFPYNIYKNQWFFGRFVIYEQQIIFSMSLALPGLFFLIRGHIKNSPVLLIEGACFLAAAAWVRGTWFVLAFLAILFIFYQLIMKKNFRSILNWPHYLFMMIPIFLMSGLLVLNFIRFDDMFDFGMKLQNPMYNLYLRNQNGLFSPETQFFDTAFKMLAYYASPALIQMSGVWEKSSSWCEYNLPCFFYNNRMLLLLVPVMLYGIYRAFCVNRKMFKIIVFLGVAALVINGLIFYMGNIVTMRYFVECYYLTILLLFAGLTAALSVKISFPLLVLIFSFYLPGNITAFAENQPELRLIKIVENKNSLVDYENISQKRRISTVQIKTDFMFKNVRWHEGVVKAAQPETFTKYNTIGMVPLKNGTIVANDLSAVYIKPRKMKGILANKSLLEFVNIKSVSKPGRIKVYIDKTAIAEFPIVQGEARTYQAAVNYDLKDDVPRRLLIYFFEENTSYLPAKQSILPAFLFDKISFLRS